MKRDFTIGFTVGLLFAFCGCAAFKNEVSKLDTPADIQCMVAALACDPNILSPANDFVLLGAIYSCALSANEVDAGPTITQEAALSAVGRLKPEAQVIARKRVAALSPSAH